MTYAFLYEGVPLIIFVAATAWRLTHELRTGVANGRFVRTARDGHDPRRYWVNVSLSGVLLAVALIAAAIRAPHWMG